MSFTLVESSFYQSRLFNRIDVDVPLEVNKVYNAEGGIAKKGYTIDKLVNAVVKQATKNIEIRGAFTKAL